MAYLVKRVYTRPNTNVPFFGATPEAFKAKVDAVLPVINSYKTNGQLLSESISFSTDKLTQTYSALWASKDVYDAYLQDPVMAQYITDRREYNQANNITIVDTRNQI